MDRIREFVLEHIQSEYDIPAGSDIDGFNFIENGYIDSVGIVSFVMELEDEFGISFDDSELTSSDFQTVGGLVEMIRKKTEEA
ncbi:MAG TPA: hypothetical protein DCL38_08085 [Lachnospiraceae bacterium]|nr:hypothetical protein [Lachnospiraceae bacterium]